MQAGDGAAFGPAVGARRHPDQFGEAGAEGAERGAADLEADLGDAEVAAAQQRHRPLDPAGHQVRVGRLAVGEAELPAEVPGRHPDLAPERLDVQRLRVLPVDPVADPPQEDEVVEPPPDAFALSRAIRGFLRTHRGGLRLELIACRHVGDRPVGAGLFLFGDAVGAGGDADDADAGAVAGGDVARGVADRDRRGEVERRAGRLRPALDRPFGDLGPVAVVGAEAAEGEVLVEVAALELDPRRRLDVPGDDPLDDPGLGEPRQDLLDPRHHPVAGRFGDRVGHVLEVLGDDRRVFLRRPRPPDHLGEDDLGDFRVGHPGAGVFVDVRLDPVEVLEGALPGDRPGAPGGQQRPVDVPEHSFDRVRHRRGR